MRIVLPIKLAAEAQHLFMQLASEGLVFGASLFARNDPPSWLYLRTSDKIEYKQSCLKAIANYYCPLDNEQTTDALNESQVLFSSAVARTISGPKKTNKDNCIVVISHGISWCIIYHYYHTVLNLFVSITCEHIDVV